MRKILTKEEIETKEQVEIIYSLLRKNKYVSRKQLALKLKVADQQMRQYLELAKQLYPICNLQDGKGYFLAKTRGDAERQLHQETSRAKKILYNTKGLKVFLGTKK